MHLEYRIRERKETTFLGKPLYYRINIQLILTEECPFDCPFCLERLNPMSGENNFLEQIKSLKRVLKEHPNARLTITGGEPGLYPEQVKKVVECFNKNSNNIFCSINTAGYSKELNGIAHINLSINDYVHQDPKKFPDCTVQTVLQNPTIEYIKNFMDNTKAQNFSFRFLSGLKKIEYPVNIWNELQEDFEIDIHTFRISDFFVYATFDYAGKHARLTLGDMWKQKQNKYENGYSNIIIHPDGRIAVNWK